MQPRDPEARRDSKGNLYAFIPNKGGHQIRRLSEDGKIVPRIRMSKKTRCKIRRVVKDFHVTQDRASDLKTVTGQGAPDMGTDVTPS